MLGVSSRTRSRNVTCYQSLDDKGKRIFKNDQRKKAKLDVIDVEKENKSDEVEGSGMVTDKGDAFIDKDPGTVAEKPIIIDSDSNSDSDDVNAHHGDVDVDVDDGSDDDCKGLCSSSDERETSDDDCDDMCSSSDDERGTSDEDFEGSESSSSEESFSSYDGAKEEEHDDDDDDDDDECGVEDQEELKHPECATPSVFSGTLENTDPSEKEDSFDSSKLYERAEKKSKGVEELWEEMEEQMDSLTGNIETNEATPEKKGYYENKSCVEKEGCFDSSKGGQKKGTKISPLFVDDDEYGVEDQEELKHAECATPSKSSSTLEDAASSENGGSTDSSKLYEEAENVDELWKEMDMVLTEAQREIDSPIDNICTNDATPEKKGYYEKNGVKRRKNEVESDDDVQVIEKKTCIEKGDCLDSSELFKGSEKNGVKRVKMEVESDEDVQVIEVKAQKKKKKKEYRLRSRQNVEPVLEELGDSTEVQNSQRKNANANEKVDSHERKVHNVRGNVRTDRKDDGDHNVKRVGQFKPKELRIMEKLFAEWGEENSKKKESMEQKEKDGGGDVHKVGTPPPACGETLPSIWSLEEKSEPFEESEDEKEIEELWEEAELYFNEVKVYSLLGKIGADEGTPKKRGCEHDFYEDEERGIYCTRCGFVLTESKDISPPVVDRFSYEGSGNRVSDSEIKGPLIDESLLDDHDGDSEAVLYHKEGTVWDLIPDVKQDLYPHQQEGFEFIWKNLAGNINLNKLESPDHCGEGGCIICHYPGTGKTRLTIMFLKSYLEVYPKCRPVIVAPASLMLTWERELKKWDIGVPFHNLKNPELSGNELCEDVDSVDWSPRDTKFQRMVKLRSWYKEKSILGISYDLYAHLAGSKTMEKNERCIKDDPKMEVNEFDLMGRFLREVPGLLVLDEGHKPRNHRSGIWQVLTEVKANKRIILSGTPFQNDFRELYNTLTLVKPSLPKTFPQELEKFCQSKKLQEKKLPEGWSWEPISSGNVTGNLIDDKINQLKSRMESIVHVYQGGILKNQLLGLKECVLTLKPDSFQKEILDSIESSQERFRFERKLALASVHPSLLCCTALTKKEESVIDKELLEKHRLKPYGGVKTKFLVKFVWLCCYSFNEKVLVFSQFIDPLVLIKEQLKSFLGWSEGKEVLYMSGKVDPNTKQSRIDTFNDPKSEAKIMLASTKACNEGISLVGASRVVLLDVVWNPSVERQAISRAYRLGQNKVVYTYRLITEGTAELTKYRKQAKKERLSELVFSDKAAAENDVPNSCAANFEDRVLDRMLRHEELKDMFGEHVVEHNERDLFSSFGVYDS